MSSPARSTIEDAILPSYVTDSTRDQEHQNFCQALTSFLGLVPGKVSPNFIDKQQDRSTEDEGDAEAIPVMER